MYPNHILYIVTLSFKNRPNNNHKGSDVSPIFITCFLEFPYFILFINIPKDINPKPKITLFIPQHTKKLQSILYIT